MNKKLNKELQNSIKKRRLYLGGSMVLDQNFDIKKYLSDVQKQVELENIYLHKKKFLPIIKTDINDIPTKKRNYNFNTIDYSNDNNNNKNNKNNIKPLEAINNLLSLSKENLFNNHIHNSSRKKAINTDLKFQKKLIDANNSVQSIKKQIEKMIKKDKEATKSSNSIFKNKNIELFITSEPRFNVIKTINEIKKREKCNSLTNVVRGKNKNLEINYKSKEDYDYDYDYIYNKLNNNSKQKIAFDRRNEDAVFEPVKILNDYKMQKQLHINPQEKSLFNYNFQNKQLTKDNVLLKFMSLETQKLYKNYNFRFDKLLNNKKTIEANESDFEEYKDIHKKACKKMGSLFINLQKKNKILADESLNCKSEIKLIEDDIKRILHQIDHLRVYGNFVNEVLGGDTTRFGEKIFPEATYDDELNIEELSKTIIKRYKCFYENVEQEKFSIENTFIDEPEKMWYKFKEMESIMVRDLFTKENLKGEIKKIKEENNTNLKYLRQKNEMLEKEYENLNEKYIYELEKYKEIETRYFDTKSEFDDLIKDFYIYIVNNMNNEAIFPNIKKISSNIEISDCIRKMNMIICDKEVYIDKLMLNLKEWEKNDAILFDDILNDRKKQLRHMKQLKILSKKINDKLKIANNLENGEFKIVFHSRKTEAPYHKPKKIVVEKVDEKLIENMENEELLKYEDNED